MESRRHSLTVEQVTNAEKRINITHPVIQIIDAHLPKLEELEQRFRLINTNSEQHRFIDENYGFLADEFVNVDSFTLEPIDIIAIWSRATEVFPGHYRRYALSELITSCYAVQSLENPAWKKFPRQFFESKEIPAELREDIPGLLYFRDRLDQVADSLDEIELYTDGTTESYSALVRREMTGDKDATRVLDEIQALRDVRNTPVLSEIKENFGNGYTPMKLIFNIRLEKLHPNITKNQ